jgi:hypothetical protein
MPSRQTPMTATAMKLGSVRRCTGPHKCVMAGLVPAIHVFVFLPSQ